MTDDERRAALSAVLSDLNPLVNRALLAWAQVVGVAESGAGVVVGVDWDLKNTLDSLNESRSADPTGLTTFLMLRGLADDLFRKTTFTALEVMSAPDKVAWATRYLRELRDLVEDPVGTVQAEDFAEHLRQAALDYGMGDAKRAQLEELLSSKCSLGFLRYDSLSSLRRLEHHQFVQGAPQAEPLRKNEHVYEFLNINSAVAAAAHQTVAGLSMVLVRDPVVELASYFAFLVRNGDTVTVVTDRDEGSHPAYQAMSRRPDRNLDRRASKHWFPYQLMDLVASEDGHRRVSRTALVRLDEEPVPLARVADLEPEQFVWAALMFDLLREEYGRKATLLPELSYTGEMVAYPHALLGPGTELVRAGHYKPLDLAPLTGAEVLAGRGDAQWEVPPTGFNDWMEERYGNEIPDEVLSVVGQGEDLKRSVDCDELVSRARVPVTLSEGGDRNLVVLTSLSPVNFGTESKLRTDRLWAARVNKMRVVQALAVAEHEKVRDEVYAWWRGAVTARKDVFLDALARGTYEAPTFEARDPERAFHHGFFKTGRGNVLARYSRGEWVSGGRFFILEWRGDVLVGGRDGKHFTCLDDGRKGSVFGVLRPTCPEALADFAGVQVGDLPWPLQHWYAEDPYSGNSILDRLDPTDWVLRNPWAGGATMTVVVVASLPAFYARCRSLGLPRPYSLALASKKQGDAP